MQGATQGMPLRCAAFAANAPATAAGLVGNSAVHDTASRCLLAGTARPPGPPRTVSSASPSAPPLPAELLQGPNGTPGEGRKSTGRPTATTTTSPAPTPVAPAAPPPPPPPPAAPAELECVICLSAARECALVPCGHRSMCFECTQIFLSGPDLQRRCPICRAKVAGSLRVFDP